MRFETKDIAGVNRFFLALKRFLIVGGSKREMKTRRGMELSDDQINDQGFTPAPEIRAYSKRLLGLWGATRSAALLGPANYLG